MRVYSICNEIVAVAQGCARSDCPQKGSDNALAVARTINLDNTKNINHLIHNLIEIMGSEVRQLIIKISFLFSVIFTIFAFIFVISTDARSAENEGGVSIKLETLRTGAGSFPTDSDVVFVNYEGRLMDGTVFDSADQTPLPVGLMIPGFSQGLKRMQVGGRYELWIPSELAYGPEGSGPIPANADIEFTVELIDIHSEQEMQKWIRNQQVR